MSALRRSLAVSAATTALDWTLFCLAALWATGAGALLLARWMSGAVGATANYALNRRWAFRARGEPKATQALRYAVTALTAVTLATLLFGVLHAATGASPRLLHPVSLAGVWLVFTFPLLSRWVFRA